MDLNVKQHLPSLVLLFGLTVVAVFLRSNSALFVPVAEDLDFAFRLMIAGTVIAVFRNEIGMSTFGVFGPVILAFSWVVVGPFWGFLVIAYIFVLTALARVAIIDLNLGTPHRVASLLVVAAIGLFVIEAAGQLQDIPSLQAVILFPVVLTTWYAERFVGSLTETGWVPATRRLAATLIGIAAAFAIITFEPLVTLVIHSPELWVALVAVNIALGTLTDVRLGEYLRFRELRRSLGKDNASDVLTMRVRNREFINKYNPAPIMAQFNKGEMKKTLHGLSIPTTATYLIAEDESDFDELRTLLETQPTFAIKPIDGYGGRDILVVRGRDEATNEFLTNRGRLTADEIVAHTRNICVGGVGDYGARREALVEGFITPDGLLADRTTGGVPDLRVITLQGFPVMSMVRLPTDESNGTANIHTGAVAVAIDILTGEASGGYQQTRDAFIQSHPDTGADLEFTIPEWEAVLAMASRAAISSGLGFAGVDIVFDEANGPMVLEVNRRPGLGIQNANMDGLLRRLRYVEDHGDHGQFQSATDRVRRAQEWAKQDWKTFTQPSTDREIRSEVKA
ncbi:sugar-transfer associated ATP-grasp domain-containing protein [Halorubrum kocurii]|uniref:Alpha-L-glutamate ligase-like protein n=1 Tax=Halorubrum kocurii JCM 14978 TaxID=1230456 RepID=M0NIH4_9EURY|nr:sugar-transfer associated ATP-grasp domain-containing protein [Halorubrum kocurii]EMA56894.1 alpha-L-glutamate ligase-like protein [Halorubrum kocurii JCM 14978]